MAGDRVEKVNGLIQHEVAPLINRYVAHKDLLITVADVRTTRNLASARVYVAVYPPAHEARAGKLLREQVGKIQSILNKRLRMKHVPKIIFVVLPTGGGTEVEQLLQALDEQP
jgi:ribosome-binding factor A